MIAALAEREAYRDWYHANKEPIPDDRLLWQAQAFRHLVHLLPGESLLEVGGGAGHFTTPLVQVSRGRNPITTATFDENGAEPDDGSPVEHVRLDAFPGPLAERHFTYVVVHNIVEWHWAPRLLAGLYDLLEDGGELVMFEPNPRNPVLALRKGLGRLFGRPLNQAPLGRVAMFELMSEIGFIRISALHTDFVYGFLARHFAWLFRNLSVVLESMPGVRTLAGQLIVHAQRPPRRASQQAVSLTTHEVLMGAVSVVVPCHNEAMNVGPLVDALRNHYGDYIHQIILVDDNSSDDTRAVIEGLASEDPRIEPVIRTPPNGVGLALREGYGRATGSWVLSMDCDFQHLMPELEDLFDAAADGADAVFGSRFSRHSLMVRYPFAKIVANRAYHLLLNLLFRCRWRDVSNNLKLVRTDLVRRLRLTEPWFAFNAEVGLQLVLMDCTVKEVPISWIDRSFDMGRSSFAVVGSAGGYARVLGRYVVETGLGFRPLNRPPPPSDTPQT